MNIGEAVTALRAGKRVHRAGWNGKGMWLILVPSISWTTSVLRDGPGTGELARLPFVAMKTANGELVPWLCSQSDLLADDWEENRT